MKFTLSIGVEQNLCETYDQTYEKKLEDRLTGLQIFHRRCDIDYNIVEACWRFEGVLTDPDYVLSRVELLLGLTKDPLTISRFVIETTDGTLGGETLSRYPTYIVLGETIVIQSFKHSVGMFLHRRTRSAAHYALEDIARGFQKMCEWFTIQTTAYKAMEQGCKALDNHHRFGDAAAKFAEAQNLILQNLQYPPAVR
jgi:hypothetical protein